MRKGQLGVWAQGLVAALERPPRVRPSTTTAICFVRDLSPSACESTRLAGVRSAKKKVVGPALEDLELGALEEGEDVQANDADSAQVCRRGSRRRAHMREHACETGRVREQNVKHDCQRSPGIHINCLSVPQNDEEEDGEPGFDPADAEAMKRKLARRGLDLQDHWRAQGPAGGGEGGGGGCLPVWTATVQGGTCAPFSIHVQSHGHGGDKHSAIKVKQVGKGKKAEGGRGGGSGSGSGSGGATSGRGGGHGRGRGRGRGK
eukprot:364899-Chlamydomonas_euryale.AAC.3